MTTKDLVTKSFIIPEGEYIQWSPTHIQSKQATPIQAGYPNTIQANYPIPIGQGREGEE